MKTKRNWRAILTLGEDILGGVAIFSLAIIPVAEIILRSFSGSGIVWSSSFLQNTVIWVAWVGGMIASRENSHLSLVSSENRNHLLIRISRYIGDIAATSINIAFAVSAASFLILGFAPGFSIGIIPISLILIILPIGYLVMGLRTFLRPRRNAPLYLVMGSLVLGLLISWPSFVNLLSVIFTKLPFILFDSVDFWYRLFEWLRWPLIGLLVFLGFHGLPIYLIIGGTALFLFSGNWGALESLPNEAYSLLTGNMIPSIPLFTIAGYLLSESQSGKRLVQFFQVALSWLPGGLAIVTVVACAYFTTFTGASGVTILALGGLLTSILVESKQYGKNFSYGLVTSSGSIGLLFPPALPIIMYAVTAQISVLDMFIGGLLPGIFLVIVLSTMGIVRSIGNKKLNTVPFNLREFLSTGRKALGDLLLPCVLLSSYFGGLTNVVETAALAVIYTVILTLVNKEFTLTLISRVLKRGIPVIGGVLVILAAAKGLSYFIVDAQVPILLTDFFKEYISSRFIFLILLNLVLLITGALMDIYSAILVVAPLIIPLGNLYGVHPVQLGIIFLANLQLGYITPPVGMNLFLASYTFKKSMIDIYKNVAPFLLVLLISVLLITYVPWFSLALLK